MQSKLFSTNKTLRIQDRLVDLSTPKLMGILNLTPDSFYDGNKYSNEKAILNRVEQMLGEGADFIDVGGYSTRPGADQILAEEELQRTIPAIQWIAKKFPEAIVSIDTFRSAVVKEAIDAGAAMINDISGGELDDSMVKTVASLHVPYVLMHMRGTPQTMAQQTSYENLLKEMLDYFHKKVSLLQNSGVKDILVDPGFGFAKTVEQNFELLNKLDFLQIAGKPILVGLSRKSMIWKTLKTNPEGALNGTSALNTIALLKGASILRVHDVREAKEVIDLSNQLRLNA
jgi:dihydropteroate synthase